MEHYSNESSDGDPVSTADRAARRLYRQETGDCSNRRVGRTLGALEAGDDPEVQGAKRIWPHADPPNVAKQVGKHGANWRCSVQPVERPEPVAGVTQNRKQRRALIASGWGLLKKLAHLGRIEALKQRACRIYLRQYFWMWGMEVVYRHQRDALRRNPPRRRVNRDP